MRKSLLLLIVVGALASRAAPILAAANLAAGNTQQLTNCTAGSAKDVGRNKNQVRCGLYPSHRDLAAARAAMTR
jgi:hypothetical protein